MVFSLNLTNIITKIKNLTVMRAILALLVILSTTQAAIAGAAKEVDVKLQGRFDFTAGHFAPNGKKDFKYMTANKKNTSFNSSTYLGAKVEGQSDDGVIYGAQIGIETTAKSSRKKPSFIYLITDYGKVELGSNKTAMSQMKITAYTGTNATGIGGGWDTWPRLNPEDYPEMPYLTGTGNYLDAKIRETGKTEYSRKISYFTPKFAGLQVGITYVPDTANLGFDSMSAHHVTYKAKIPGYSFAVKDGIAAGVTYERQLAEDVSMKTSVTSERGKVVAYDVNNNKVTNKKFRNLSTYNIGAELKVNNTSFAGSYGNHMKSFTSKDVDTISRKSDMYSLGARQNFGKAGISLTFFKSSHRSNELTVGNLGVEYKVMPGLLPYAQWSSYVTKGRYRTQASGEKKTEKRKGQVILVGAKLQF